MQFIFDHGEIEEDVSVYREINDVNGIEYSATLSKCGMYRYDLTRIWDKSKPPVAFIGVNPSTADAMNDDATIRRCMRFAESWDHGGIVMLNLFAFRARHPKDMKAAKDPIGIHNNEFLLKYSNTLAVVAAWGTNGAYLERDKRVLKLLYRCEPLCLGYTKDRHPRHPLFVKGSTPLEIYEYER